MYMAPERYEMGLGKQFTDVIKMDYWSLGDTLLSFVTGINLYDYVYFEMHRALPQNINELDMARRILMHRSNLEPLINKICETYVVNSPILKVNLLGSVIPLLRINPARRHLMINHNHNHESPEFETVELEISSGGQSPP